MQQRNNLINIKSTLPKLTNNIFVQPINTQKIMPTNEKMTTQQALNMK